LANSPHDGRNITVAHIVAAATEALNWDPQVAALLAGTAITKTMGVESTDLEGLNIEGVEHHASLTRLDASEGDSLHLNMDMLEKLMDDAEGDYIDIASLGRSRARAEARSGPLLGAMNNQANLEAAAILTTFPEVSDWAPEDFLSLRSCKQKLRVWLTEERLPVELGWETPAHRLTLADLGNVPGAIEKAKLEAAEKL
jgi:hypothetical protein